MKYIITLLLLLSFSNVISQETITVDTETIQLDKTKRVNIQIELDYEIYRNPLYDVFVNTSTPIDKTIEFTLYVNGTPYKTFTSKDFIMSVRLPKGVNKLRLVACVNKCSRKRIRFVGMGRMTIIRRGTLKMA